MTRVLPASLFANPNAIAADYSRFGVADRMLLSGHSHQAWPDCGFEGQQKAWLDAAELVDRKWERAFAKAERVRDGWRRLLDEPDAEVALGANTHELVIRLLSALPLDQRPRIVTTDGEFHTLRRQFDRLEEAGIEIHRVAAEPVDTLAARLAQEVDARTALVGVSCVMFRSAHIVPNLGELATACARQGSALLVDSYHALNVVPFSVPRQGLESAFVVGGGYKYCQFGEGNCFLRVPRDCDLRPVITGWYAEFEALEEKADGTVKYGRGAGRFAGATYDPTAHYRAASVLDYFEERGLTAEVLREVSQHQVGVLADGFDALDMDPRVIARDRSAPLANTAGFLALRAEQAGVVSEALFERGVANDYRDDVLRLGPAPYLSDSQLRAAIEILGEIIKDVNS
ncbi:MAG: kynureninase [Acidobacteria bacterium]|nr:kynureninase [Acidobacteriota bacterium]